jgi:predicted AAA+ superfamily ATPase
MLLRETLETVLSSPAPTLSVEDEVIRHFQPGWKPAMASHALALTGVRRCGKSTLQGRVSRSGSD